jgi:hypothetical protein
VAYALSNPLFVNFGGGGGGSGERGALSTGSDDVLRVVQTLMAAQVITGLNKPDAPAPVPFPVPTGVPAARR